MRIEITECIGSQRIRDLFYTLSQYKTIDKMLLDIIDDKIDLPFLDVRFIYYVKETRCCCYIRDSGINTDKESLKKHYNKIKKIPARYRQIPNDDMLIKCDNFESELFIYI